jgi:hypothetical protein
VRQQVLAFLVENRGIDTPEVRAALDWALLRVGGPERLHALRLITPGEVGDLTTAAVLKLAQDYRAQVADPTGKQALVLAIGALRGEARPDVVQALMDLVVQGERAVCTTAATALGTTLAWDTPVAVNDLATRAASDPDPVIRQALMAFLLRLDPLSVLDSAPPSGPWTALAQHLLLLNQWRTPTPLIPPDERR